MHEFRRSPRRNVEALCWWEAPDGRESSALAVDLSTRGLRIERPYVGGASARNVDGSVPLQLEIPGFDEIVWAIGDTCFDQLVPAKTTALDRSPDRSIDRSMGFIRRTGYRIVLAAARDLRRIEEYVRETHRASRMDPELEHAGSYLRA